MNQLPASPLATVRPSPLVLEPVHDHFSIGPRLLSGEKLTLGSAADASIVLPVQGVQPRHCAFITSGSRWLLQAWDPRVWLNQAPVRQSALRPGDRLAIGPVEFRLRAPYDGEFGAAGMPPETLIDAAFQESLPAFPPVAAGGDTDESADPDETQSPLSGAEDDQSPAGEAQTDAAPLLSAELARPDFSPLDIAETNHDSGHSEPDRTPAPARLYRTSMWSSVVSTAPPVLPGRATIDSGPVSSPDSLPGELLTRPDSTATSVTGEEAASEGTETIHELVNERLKTVAAQLEQVLAEKQRIDTRTQRLHAQHRQVTQREDEIRVWQDNLALRESEIELKELRLQESDAELVNLSQDMARLKKQLEQEQHLLTERSAEFAAREKELAGAQARVADAECNQVRQLRELEAARRQFADRESELDDRQKALATERQTLARTLEELTRRERALDETEELQSQRSRQLAARESALSEQSSQLTAQMAECGRERDQLEIAERNLNQVRDQLASDRESLLRQEQEMRTLRAFLDDGAATLAAREQVLAQREAESAQTARSLAARESAAGNREREFALREAQLAEARRDITRERMLLEDRQQKLALQEGDIAIRLADLQKGMLREQDRAARNDEIEKAQAEHEQSSGSREAALAAALRDLKVSELDLEDRRIRLDAEERALHSRTSELARREAAHSLSATELLAAQNILQDRLHLLREQQLSIVMQLSDLAAREQVLADRLDQADKAAQIVAAHESAVVQRELELAQSARELDTNRETLAKDRETLQAGLRDVEQQLASLKSRETSLNDSVAQAGLTAEYLSAQEASIAGRQVDLDRSGQELTRARAVLDEDREWLRERHSEVSREIAELEVRDARLTVRENKLCEAVSSLELRESALAARESEAEHVVLELNGRNDNPHMPLGELSNTGESQIEAVRGIAMCDASCMELKQMLTSREALLDSREAELRQRSELLEKQCGVRVDDENRLRAQMVELQVREHTLAQGEREFETRMARAAALEGDLARQRDAQSATEELLRSQRESGIRAERELQEEAARLSALESRLNEWNQTLTEYGREATPLVSVAQAGCAADVASAGVDSGREAELDAREARIAQLEQLLEAREAELLSRALEIEQMRVESDRIAAEPAIQSAEQTSADDSMVASEQHCGIHFGAGDSEESDAFRAGELPTDERHTGPSLQGPDGSINTGDSSEVVPRFGEAFSWPADITKYAGTDPSVGDQPQELEQSFSTPGPDGSEFTEPATFGQQLDAAYPPLLPDFNDWGHQTTDPLLVQGEDSHLSAVNETSPQPLIPDESGGDAQPWPGGWTLPGSDNEGRSDAFDLPGAIPGETADDVIASAESALPAWTGMETTSEPTAANWSEDWESKLGLSDLPAATGWATTPAPADDLTGGASGVNHSFDSQPSLAGAATDDDDAMRIRLRLAEMFGMPELVGPESAREGQERSTESWQSAPQAADEGGHFHSGMSAWSAGRETSPTAATMSLEDPPSVGEFPEQDYDEVAIVARSDEQDESSDLTAAPAPVTAEPDTAGDVDAEDPASIDSYMEKLLARSRRPGTAPAPASQGQSYRPQTKETEAQAHPSAEPVTTEEPVNPEVRMRPRHDANEIRKGMSTLRAIANQSTRVTLARYAWARTRRALRFKLALALVAFVISGYLMSPWAARIQGRLSLAIAAAFMGMIIGCSLSHSMWQIKRVMDGTDVPPRDNMSPEIAVAMDARVLAQRSLQADEDAECGEARTSR